MSPIPEPPSAARHRGTDAFTLIELITVLAIVVALCALIVPAVTGLKGGTDLTSAAYQIQEALDQARTYAVSNNCYTWVGFFEEDISNSNATPANRGVGRLVISIVASNDGTTIYNKAKAAAATTQTITPSRLAQIGKLIKLDNIHVLNATGQTVGIRQAGILTAANLVGLSAQPLLFNFQYPLNGGAAVYTFGLGPAQPGSVPVLSGIVQFSPQGEASSEAQALPGMVPCRELAVQQTHGTQPAASRNIIAVDIGGLTGQTTLYRP